MKLPFNRSHRINLPILAEDRHSRRCFIRPQQGRTFSRGPQGPRVNRQIRTPQIRLIGADGEQLGIFALDGALKLAEEQGLDLVEISPTSKPPVCKIMDHGKYKYQQQKKKHESKKHQIVVQVKEVKMRPNIDEHDIEFKIRHVRRFLEGKDKAKITIQFRGREMMHAARAKEVVNRVIKDIEDVGVVESPPRMEGRMLSMIIAPK